MKIPFLETNLENRGLIVFNSLLIIGIVAQSLNIYKTSLQLDRELLQRCQNTLQMSMETETLMKENVTRMQDLEYRLLQDLRNQDPIRYQQLLLQTGDVHDYLSLPETKIKTPKNNRVKSRLNACQENVDAHATTFTELNVIFNDTFMDVDGLMEEIYPTSPLISD